MTRVALIVTGDVERLALHHSLGPIFKDVTFETLKRDSFMSDELQVLPRLTRNMGNPTLVEKLAEALVKAVDPGRTGEPADLAFLIEDLELKNAHAPERAVAHVREAVPAYLDTYWSNASRRERSAKLVRERCSFHILAPMVEAYFFGEPAALTRAGAKRAAQVDGKTHDLEDFLTADTDFLAPPDGGAVWARPGRARHPKAYLQFLCDSTGTQRRAYRETKEGVAALRALDWPVVLEPASHVRFARAFLADLAAGLGRHDVVSALQGEPHALTSRREPGNVLRNL